MIIQIVTNGYKGRPSILITLEEKQKGFLVAKKKYPTLKLWNGNEVKHRRQYVFNEYELHLLLSPCIYCIQYVTNEVL